jgi:hypothetical protein
MATVTTPNLYPGERSLPAELRTQQGGNNFAQRRLAASLQPSADPTSWNAMRLRGLMGLGQDADPSDVAEGIDNSGYNNPAATAIINDDSNIYALNLSSTLTQDAGLSPASAAALASTVSGYVSAPSGYTGATVVAPTAATPAAPTGYQWAQLVNSEGNTLAKVLTIAQGGSSVTLPNGTQLLYGASGTSSASALTALSSVTGLSSNTLLMIGLAVGAFFLIEGMKK